MNKLILLLAGLVSALAAPQFVFVLPPEFLKQMQKPVGEASQPGQQPHIPVFPIESLLGSSSTLSERVVPTPVVAETIQGIERIGLPAPELESTPVADTVIQPTDVIVDLVAESVPQIINEGTLVEQAVPLEESVVNEAVPIVEEAPVEAPVVEDVSPVILEILSEATVIEEVVPDVQEITIETAIKEVVVTADTPAQDITAEPSITLQTIPVEEIITSAIVETVTDKLVPVEEVIIAEAAVSNTAEDVVIVEDVIPNANAGTTQVPISITSTTVPSINKQISAPTNQVVDPRMNVDPRFRNYIYVNDAPDVVAAKVALFNLQAAALPTQNFL